MKTDGQAVLFTVIKMSLTNPMRGLVTS